MLGNDSVPSAIAIISNEYLEDELLIKATAHQVIKDFHWYNLSIIFERKEITPYQELFDQIKPQISEMMLSNHGTLSALLYTIDIPDHWWSQLRTHPDHEMVVNTLTDLILRRELLKVITRMKFRKGSQDMELPR